MKDIVSPPALRLAAHGLIADAPRANQTGNTWENGVTFTPAGCEALFAHSWGCPAEDKSDFQGCTPAAVFTPILVEAGLEWSSLDMGANPQKIVEDALEFGSSSVVERILSNGMSDTVGAITKTALSQAVSTAVIKGRLVSNIAHPDFKTLAPTPNAAAANAAKSLGTLEAKLLDAVDHTGSAGTIFVNPIDASQFYDLLFEEDGKLWTKLTGSQVIVGNFLPGVMYGVLGEIELYLADISPLIETVDRKTNSWYGRAERLVLVKFNSCAVFAQTV